MAIFPESGMGTLAVKTRVLEEATNPRPDPARDDEASPQPKEDRTPAPVKPTERGDRKVKDLRHDTDGTLIETSMASATTRKEVAARLVKAIGRVISSCGAIKMAADLELLKRELSRSHDVLRPIPTENDYLSIVVLVESELGTKLWREISTYELNALKSAIEIGLKAPQVTYDDYNRTLRTLNASGWRTGPILELGVVEDLPDDEEEPADS